MIARKPPTHTFPLPQLSQDYFDAWQDGPEKWELRHFVEFYEDQAWKAVQEEPGSDAQAMAYGGLARIWHSRPDLYKDYEAAYGTQGLKSS